MKIQNINPQQFNNKNPKFGNGMDLALRFLETSPALGACAVDLGSMVIPRTTTDMINRGPSAGMETARREASGTANHLGIAAYGALGGLIAASGLNSKYGIRADKIFADNNTIDILGSLNDKHNDTGSYLKRIFGSLETSALGENGSMNVVKISKPTQEKVVERFIQELEKKPSTLDKQAKKYLKALILNDTGSENAFRFRHDKKKMVSSLETTLENIYSVTKTFLKDEVKNADTSTFLKSLKKANLNRSLIGMGIGAAIGMSVQPVNVYLSKKKTGTDGFVGVEGRSKDNSFGFKVLKGLTALGFTTGVLSTIGKEKGILSRFKNLPKNLQYNGLVPTLDQFKFIYGATIMTRFLVARDKDELRESVVKDTLGFLNWLILGNFVAKLATKGLDKSKTLVTYEGNKKVSGFAKFLKSRVATRDEVVQRFLKKAGIDAIKDGKALSFKELMRLVPKVGEGALVRTKIRNLNIAQLAGYLYSGIVLGVLLPKLNIHMTNQSEKKRQAKLAAVKAANGQIPSQTPAMQANMLKPENMAFLAKNM